MFMFSPYSPMILSIAMNSVKELLCSPALRYGSDGIDYDMSGLVLTLTEPCPLQPQRDGQLSRCRFELKRGQCGTKRRQINMHQLLSQI